MDGGLVSQKRGDDIKVRTETSAANQGGRGDVSWQGQKGRRKKDRRAKKGRKRPKYESKKAMRCGK